MIYSGYPHYEIFAERLTPDYLDSTRISSYIPSEGHVEAPVIFKRNGIYYFMFGTNCNRGPEGSDLKVYTADHPMGPYHFRSNVNRDDNGEIIIKAQQNNVALVSTRTGVEYIWTAERWRSGKTPGWELGHSFQYWAPLRFNQMAIYADLSGWIIGISKFPNENCEHHPLAEVNVLLTPFRF